MRRCPARRHLHAQFLHQEGKCCWCLEPMDMSRIGRGENLQAATWEHIVPRTLGGSSELQNLVLAHKRCNALRGHKIMTPHYQSYTEGAV